MSRFLILSLLFYVGVFAATFKECIVKKEWSELYQLPDTSFFCFMENGGQLNAESCELANHFTNHNVLLFQNKIRINSEKNSTEINCYMFGEIVTTYFHISLKYFIVWFYQQVLPIVNSVSLGPISTKSLSSIRYNLIFVTNSPHDIKFMFKNFEEISHLKNVTFFITNKEITEIQCYNRHVCILNNAMENIYFNHLDNLQAITNLRIYVDALSTLNSVTKLTYFDDTLLTKNLTLLWLYNTYYERLAYFSVLSTIKSVLTTLGCVITFDAININNNKKLISQHFDSTSLPTVPVLIFISASEERLKKITIAQHRPFVYDVLNNLKVLAKQFLGEICRSGIKTYLQQAKSTYKANYMITNLSELYENQKNCLAADNQTLLNDKSKISQNYHFKILKSKSNTMHESGKKVKIITSSYWYRQVESTSLRTDLSFSRVSQDASRVHLVIFFKRDCQNCDDSWPTFEHLKERLVNKAITMFAINCSTERLLCERLKVRGFPSIVAYRSYSWQHAEHCMTRSTMQSLRLPRSIYHGALQSSSIEAWLNDFTQPIFTVSTTEQNKRFSNKHCTHSPTAQLLADVVLNDDRRLPRGPGGKRNPFFCIHCFRLVCERLLGVASCHARLLHNRNFDVQLVDKLVVLQIRLRRCDSLTATILQAGQSLSSLLEQPGHIHELHKSHRYHLNMTTTCEEDRAFCSDLLVNFTRDHSHTLLTAINEELFHQENSLLAQEDNQLVLLILAHGANFSDQSTEFFQTIDAVARKVYNKVFVTTLDVDVHSAWAGSIIPLNYVAHFYSDEWNRKQMYVPDLFYYPRFVLLFWKDHSRAAFYPSPNTPRNATKEEPLSFKESELLEWITTVHANPERFMIPAEHF